MSLKEQLCEKLSASYDTYIADLTTKPPRQIIDEAYAVIFKADIILCFENEIELDDDALAALLALEGPLDELYANWLRTDVTHMDDLCDSIKDFAERRTIDD